MASHADSLQLHALSGAELAHKSSTLRQNWNFLVGSVILRSASKRAPEVASIAWPGASLFRRLRVAPMSLPKPTRPAEHCLSQSL